MPGSAWPTGTSTFSIQISQDCKALKLNDKEAAADLGQGLEVGTGKTSGSDYLGLDLDVVGGLLQLEVPFALGDLGVVQKPESSPGKDEHGVPEIA